MILERREFLRMLSVTAGGATVGGCQFWSVPDELVELAARGPGLETFVNSVCGMCDSACGLTVRLVDGMPVGLKGNPHAPMNRGGLCPVGHAGLDVLYSPDRLQVPMRRADGGGLVESSWPEALEQVVARLAALRGEAGAGRVAMLTGDADVLFQDLARQFIHAQGSASIAGPTRFDAAARLMQGLDETPGYDLGGCDLVLSLGLDLFEDGPSPIHAISALIGSRKDELAAVIHVGTRLSPTAAKAVDRVPVLPDTHAAFALGVAHVLVREGRYDAAFVREHTHGFEPWTDPDGRAQPGFRRMLLEDYYPDRAAQLCGCEPESIIRVARRFAAAEAPLAVAGGDAVQGSNGTWTAMAVNALNALTGAFDRPGGVVLPPPIPFNPLPSVPTPGGEDLFAAPQPSGIPAADPAEALAAAVLDRGEQIDLVFLVDTNPAFESPAAGRFREALAQIPLVVAVSSFVDETAELADILLPAHSFLERWQSATTPATVGFSSLGVSAPVIEPLYDTRHPADVLLEIARESGGTVAAALPWESFDAYVKDRVSGIIQSGQGAVVTGSFEDSWVHYLEERGWRFQEYRNADEYWNDLVGHAGWWNPVQIAGDWSRVFRTRTGRFEFYSFELESRLRAIGSVASGNRPTSADALEAGIAALGLQGDASVACMPHYERPEAEGDGELTLVPFRPLTARGRLGTCSPMLVEMFGYPHLSGWETWIELTPELAHEHDLGDGDRVAVQASRAEVEAIVRVQPGGAHATVHMPVGLGHTAAGTAAGIGSNPLSLLAGVYDPLSGARALNGTRVSLRLLERRAHGEPAPIEGELES